MNLVLDGKVQAHLDTSFMHCLKIRRVDINESVFISCMIGSMPVFVVAFCIVAGVVVVVWLSLITVVISLLLFPVLIRRFLVSVWLWLLL